MVMKIAKEKIAELKRASNIIEVVADQVPLKQAGKNFIGLCPFHNDKTPSFSVSSDKQMYYCFGCGATGDVFEFIQKKDAVSFLDAARILAGKYGIDISQNSTTAPSRPHQTPRPPQPSWRQYSANTPLTSLITNTFSPSPRPDPPPKSWQEKAAKLVSWSHEKLLENPKQLKILSARGIKKPAIRRFQLGWNPGQDGKDIFRSRESWGLSTELKNDRKKKLWLPIGLVIPVFSGNQIIRVRIRRPEGQPKYIIIPGSSMATWIVNESERVYIILESELDSILLFQEAASITGIVALGSAQTKPDATAYKILKQSALILNALDYDAAGGTALKWWENSFPQNERWPVPRGKDPGEAYQSGVDLKEWIVSGLPAAWIRQGAPGRSPTCLYIEKEGQPVIPESPINELKKIIKGQPVIIINTPKQLTVKISPSWQSDNWDISQRISELVFYVPEVFEYLTNHPAQKITGENI